MNADSHEKDTVIVLSPDDTVEVAGIVLEFQSALRKLKYGPAAITDLTRLFLERKMLGGVVVEVGTLLFVDLDGKEPMFTDLEKEALKTFREIITSR